MIEDDAVGATNGVPGGETRVSGEGTGASSREDDFEWIGERGGNGY
jgi:hypothetical protein